MKGFVGGLALMIACGCGRTENRAPTGVPEGDAGAPSVTASGVGPIDTADLPMQTSLVCPEHAEVPALQLPCLIGQNLSGNREQPGIHEVECNLVGVPTNGPIAFMLPLAQVPSWLNTPKQLPFEGAPAAPLGLPVDLGGAKLLGTLTGTITFTQVDLDSRAFLGTLEGGRVVWTSAGAGNASSFSCDVLNGPIWAVAGGFL